MSCYTFIRSYPCTTFTSQPDWLHDDDSNEMGDNDDDEGSGETLPGSQHVLVLLDCRREMFPEFLPDPEYPEEKCSPMDLALAACEKLVRQKVRSTTTSKSGTRDGFGVVFYNTRSRSPRKKSSDEDDVDMHTKKTAKSPTSDNEDNGDADKEEQDDDDDDDDGSVGYARHTIPTTVHELLPLAPPGKQAVLIVKAAHTKDLFTEERELDIEKEYGHPAAAAQDGQDKEEHPGTHPLDDAFYQVMQIFGNAKCVNKPKVGAPSDIKSVWIFTNNDDPTAGRSEVLEVLKTKASDFRDLDIEITVWPLPTATAADATKGESTFAYEKFYDEIGASTPARGMTVESMQDLLEELTAHFKKTRRVLDAPLLMPDWRGKTDPERPAVWLDFFRLYQQSKPPVKVQIHQETGRYVFVYLYLVRLNE